MWEPINPYQQIEIKLPLVRLMMFTAQVFVILSYFIQQSGQQIAGSTNPFGWNLSNLGYYSSRDLQSALLERF